ncbi:hypothetical protein ACFXKC_42040 [Streptomyces sp. NPDC059340]|uniref:hypothetical protein n=1 Tax=Streptomyces sp. NPDC059340 TaxID=3346806 RepID=UPI0036B0DD1B
MTARVEGLTYDELQELQHARSAASGGNLHAELAAYTARARTDGAIRRAAFGKSPPGAPR